MCVNSPASVTQIVDAKELDDARLIMSEDEYLQEFECSWTAAVKGSYWAMQMEAARDNGRVKSFQIEPTLPVSTYWDLGVSDSTSIWFAQYSRMEREIRVIAAYENQGEGLQHYINYLHSFAAKHSITYDYHWAPHDIEVRELSSGVSRKQTAAKMGIKFDVSP